LPSSRLTGPDGEGLLAGANRLSPQYGCSVRWRLLQSCPVSLRRSSCQRAGISPSVGIKLHRSGLLSDWVSIASKKRGAKSLSVGTGFFSRMPTSPLARDVRCAALHLLCNALLLCFVLSCTRSPLIEMRTTICRTLVDRHPLAGLSSSAAASCCLRTPAQLAPSLSCFCEYFAAASVPPIAPRFLKYFITSAGNADLLHDDNNLPLGYLQYVPAANHERELIGQSKSIGSRFSLGSARKGWGQQTAGPHRFSLSSAGHAKKK